MTRKTTRIFLVLSTIIACIDIVFIWINYRSSRSALDENLTHVSKTIRASFEQALAATEIRMLQIATFVAADTDIQQLFLEGKKAVEAEGGDGGGQQAAIIREQLYKKVSASRAALADSFDFRQLHFHFGPGSLSFLRVHAPHKFGDRMDTVRHTIVAVNEFKKPVSGFETGRVYSGIRGVAPVFAYDPETGKRVYVGALEAGTSFESTLKNVAELQNINLAAAFTVDHLKANVWPRFLEKIFKESPPVSGLEVEVSTDPMIIDILRKNLLSDPSRRADRAIASFGDKPYCISFTPLRDFLGRSNPDMPNVGTIIAWRNIENEIHNFQLTQKVNIIYGILGFCLIELLLFSGLRASTKKFLQAIEQGKAKLQTTLHKVEKSEKQLKSAQQIAHIGHWEFDLVAKSLYWSDEIYRIFGLEPQQLEASYEVFIDIVHSEDRNFVNKSHTELIKNKTKHDIEHRIVLKNGDEKWVREICSTEYDANGRAILSIGIVQDITEIKALRGIIPICSKCHKVRDDEGYWHQVDQYITEHSDAVFSHGMCLQCSDELYGGLEWYEKGKKTGEIKE
jgi:diguanylate cyclase